MRVNSQRGFSLIELLVVIAIIAVLASLAAAALPRAKVSAQRAKCASNLRQIGAAVHLYAADHHSQFPRTRHVAGAEEAWIFALGPYLDEMDEVRISPADPKGAERLARRSTSYLLNDVVVDPLLDPFGNPLPGGGGRLMSVEQPSRTLLAVVVSDNRGTGPSNDHTHARRWNSFQRFLSDVEPDRHRLGERSADRTQGDAPYLYVDGSVRFFSAQQIKDAFAAGNIGLPGRAP
jgi:prepilin-type N-terminal cleavage/methylation domain-containing protein